MPSNVTDIKLCIHITAVPSRREHVEKMLASLNSPHVTVFWDNTYRGIWWNVKRAWTTTSMEYTHKLVMSDDLAFCPDFMQTMLNLISLLPDKIISAYTPTSFALQVQKQGGHWINRNAIGGPSILLPKAKVFEFLRFDEQYNDPAWDPSHRGKPEGDDLRVCMWMLATNQVAWYPVPSPAQHTDIKSNFGGSPNRQSHVFLGEDIPLADLDWTTGIDHPRKWTYSYSPAEMKMFLGKKNYVHA